MLRILNDAPTSRKRRLIIGALCAGGILLSGCGKGADQTNGTGPAGGGTATGGGNPAKPGTTQKVLLVWNKAKNEWQVKLNGGPAQKPKDAHTRLDRNTTGPTMFEVSIDGGGSTPPSFSNDPLWVWEGEGQKSTPQNGIKSTQILGPVMAKNGTLVFWDLNQGDPVTLNYQFNFTNGVPPVDPIIDNGGHD
jgi:hypothetical protein